MNIANKPALSIMVNSRYLLPDMNSHPGFVGVLPGVFMEGTSRKGVLKMSRYVFDSFKIHTLFFSFSIDEILHTFLCLQLSFLLNPKLQPAPIGGFRPGRVVCS